MKKVLDTVIAKWLTDSVQNEDVRKNFTEGMERLVKDTRAESGIWTVACEASNLHARKLDEIERLRTECESLKALNQGAFGSEASRKRGRDEAPAAAGGSGDFWGFELDTSRTQWTK
jgi:hypothetical protein